MSEIADSGVPAPTAAEASARLDTTGAAEITGTAHGAEYGRSDGYDPLADLGPVVMAGDVAHLPAGAGGGWDTIDERPGGAVSQMTEHSCGSACAEMLTDGEVSQQEIWELAGDGAWSPTIAEKLGELSQHSWQGGYLGEANFDSLVARGSWAAELYESGKESHFVVVDGVGDDERISIRDPWGEGSTYLMDRDEFSRVWTGLAVFRD